MLGRGGTWTGLAVAGLTTGRFWYFQNFAAGAGPNLSITTNDNGVGAFDPANVVSTSAVITDVNGNPVYSTVAAAPADMIKVVSHVGQNVVLSAAPHASYGALRLWYLYATVTPAAFSERAPDFVRTARAEFLDNRFLNQALNLFDLTDLVAARHNLGYADIPAGRVLLGDGGTLPSSDAELFYKPGPNYLGIGAIDPLAPLHVTAAQAELARLENTALAGAYGYWSVNQLNLGGLAFKNSALSSSTLLLTAAGPVRVQDQLAVVPGSDKVGLTVRRVAGQASHLQDWLDDSGLPLASVTAAGDVIAQNVLALGLLLEDPGAGTNQVTLLAPNALASSYNLTLPPNPGTNLQFLRTNGAGVTSWATVPTEVNAGAAGRLGVYDGAGSLISDHWTQNGNPVALQIATHLGLAAARTYTLPDAGADAEFVMSKGSQIITGSKDFRDRPTFGDGIFLEDPGAGTNKVGLTAAAGTAAYPITLPPAQGVAGSSLVNDGAGNLVWKVPSNNKGGSIPIPNGTMSVAVVFGTARPGGDTNYSPFAIQKNVVDTDPQHLGCKVIAHLNTGFTIEFTEPAIGGNNILLWGTVEHANA